MLILKVGGGEAVGVGVGGHMVVKRMAWVRVGRGEGGRGEEEGGGADVSPLRTESVIFNDLHNYNCVFTFENSNNIRTQSLR